ncbi:MAG: PadR family transcriptional regulator [Actinobacteria bacterium]|nr:MAG: PadR family transcriptional regulator [Actinomycetota bacterium]
MPIHHAVLGLLEDGPSYGYELKANLESAIGPQFGELNIGHIYQVLDRLVRDGLVSGREVAQRDRPDKVVYRSTKAGRLELERWLAEPSVRRAGYRDDFFLKLFVASRADAERVRDVVRVQREALLAELSVFAGLKRKHRDDPLVALLIEAATLHTSANLKVADLADGRAEQIAAAARVLSHEVPTRGRASAGQA